MSTTGLYYNLTRQLKNYTAILNTPAGRLLYMILGYNHGVTDYFPEYLVTLNEFERREILERIEKDAAELQGY
jgi:hypothetical protein